MRRLSTFRSRTLLAALALFAALGGWAPAPGQAAGGAHPAPSVIHDYLVQIGPGGGQVFLRLSVSPQLVPQVYRLIDKDGDGVTQPGERQVWLDHYLANMRFTVDDKPVPMGLTGASTVDQANLVVSMQHPITVTMQLTFTVPADAAGSPPADHHFVLADNSNYVNYDEYYASFEDLPGAITLAHDLTQPANPATFEAVFERDPQTAPAGAAPAAPPAGSGPAGGSLPDAGTWYQSIIGTFQTQLAGFLDNPGRDSGFGLFLFLLAVGLGAIHALTPGHGKAVVAAYLVGSRGRVRDAVALGAIVTLTHTLSVVVLGLALLLLTNFVLPRWLQPALELASGLLVVGLGLYLLAGRLRSYRRPALAGAGGAPAGAHDHDHPHPHDPGHGPGEHSHDHAHDQAHGAGGHSHVPPAGATARDLLALGISGGLVPCPEALAILFLTVTARQVGFGLLLVSSFSIGLAAVLIGIGILMVQAKGLLERVLPGQGGTSPRWVRALPVASAVVVTVLGVALMLAAIGQKWA